ncbi:hypothetical protein C8R46DRAFT_1285229 [Mycena filopes]|nr:hypothetical protein C8R46DRAFT_1285229 [Mycena filopes]
MAPKPSTDGPESTLHTNESGARSQFIILPDAIIDEAGHPSFPTITNSRRPLLLRDKPHKLQSKAQLLDDMFKTGSPRAREFFAQPNFKIVVSEIIEQPLGRTIIWGFTNDHESREEELGKLLPVLNWSLCAAYEQTFGLWAVLPSVLAKRARLGSLIAITLLHESMHGYLRWRLGSSVAAILNTPGVDKNGKTESGWLLERELFQGVIKARIPTSRCTATDRFDYIDEIFLENAQELRIISSSRLRTFHAAILAGNINVSSIKSCFSDTTAPSLTLDNVVRNDRTLCRVVSPVDDAPHEPQWSTIPATSTDGPPPELNCLMALRRADPQAYEAFWSQTPDTDIEAVEKPAMPRNEGRGLALDPDSTDFVVTGRAAC